ncbi:MAG: hypothetical protein AAGI23_09520 [Bacteroidota bacterium]
MKGSFILFCLFMFGFSIAQEGIVINISESRGTTEEEYLYCTKGYKSQIEKGLDAQKEGYKFEGLGTYSNGNLKIVKMIRTEDDIVKAYIFKVKYLDQILTYCMPNQYASDVMWSRWRSVVTRMERNRRNMILMAFSKLVVMCY